MAGLVLSPEQTVDFPSRLLSVSEGGVTRLLLYHTYIRRFQEKAQNRKTDREGMSYLQQSPNALHINAV